MNQIQNISDDKNLLSRVEQQIHSFIPDAKVILYGSRARGDFSAVSDWDFLILVPKPLNRSRIIQIKNSLYDLELETDTVITSIIRTYDEWNSPKYSVLPFKHIIDQEGVWL